MFRIIMLFVAAFFSVSPSAEQDTPERRRAERRALDRKFDRAMQKLAQLTADNPTIASALEEVRNDIQGWAKRKGGRFSLMFAKRGTVEGYRRSLRDQKIAKELEAAGLPPDPSLWGPPSEECKAAWAAEQKRYQERKREVRILRRKVHRAMRKRLSLGSTVFAPDETTDPETLAADYAGCECFYTVGGYVTMLSEEDIAEFEDSEDCPEDYNPDREQPDTATIEMLVRDGWIEVVNRLSDTGRKSSNSFVINAVSAEDDDEEDDI